MMERKTYPLRVGDELWTAYKETVPSTQTLEQPIVRAIIDRIIDVNGREAVPDVYLEWYDGDRDEYPKPFAKRWREDSSADGE